MDKHLLNVLRKKLLESQGGKSVADWSARDFEDLSEGIFQKTKVRLSVTTLKRLMGRVNSQVKPSQVTLDAVADYLGHNGWGEFAKAELLKEASSKKPRNKRNLWWAAGIGLAILLAAIGFWFSQQSGAKEAEQKKEQAWHERVNVSDIEFRVVNPVDTVPVNHLFEFDLSALGEGDSAYLLDKTGYKYYLDKSKKHYNLLIEAGGFATMDFVVNDSVLETFDLFSISKGWETSIYYYKEGDPENNIIYLDTMRFEEGAFHFDPMAMRDSFLIDIAKGFQLMISQADDYPFHSTDLEVSLEVKQPHMPALPKSQWMELSVLFGNGQLSEYAVCAKRYQEKLDMYTFNSDRLIGKNENLVAFTADLDQWQKLMLKHTPDSLIYYRNGEHIYSVAVNNPSISMKGIAIKYRGNGYVRNIQLKNSKGKTMQLKLK